MIQGPQEWDLIMVFPIEMMNKKETEPTNSRWDESYEWRRDVPAGQAASEEDIEGGIFLASRAGQYVSR